MESFKKTAIGEIPSDWKVSKLADFTDEITDYVAAGSFASLRENVNVFKEANYAIYVRLTDLRKGLGHSDQKYVDKTSYEFLSKSNLFGREILFANIGANVGEVWMMPELHEKATIAPNMIVIRANNKHIVPEYLHSYLCSPIGLRQIDKIIAGSGHPKINKTELRQLIAIIPTFPEQQKIVEIISIADDKIEVINQQILETQQLKKGMMQRLLRKGVDHTEFKDSSLGEIPSSWEVKPIGKISTVVRGASPRPKGDPRYYGGDIPRLMGRDVSRDGKYVTPRIDFLTEEGAKKSRFMPKNTLVMICSGDVGVPSILAVDACVHDGFLAFPDLSDNCNIDYLYYIFDSLHQRFNSSATHGGIFTNLTTTIIKEFQIPIPSLLEQKKIAEILSTVDDKLDVLVDKKGEYQQLKKGLMQQLLTGKVRVN